VSLFSPHARGDGPWTTVVHGGWIPFSPHAWGWSEFPSSIFDFRFALPRPRSAYPPQALPASPMRGKIPPMLPGPPLQPATAIPIASRPHRPGASSLISVPIPATRNSSSNAAKNAKFNSHLNTNRKMEVPENKHLSVASTRATIE
jgi:hypothetical protein